MADCHIVERIQLAPVLTHWKLPVAHVALLLAFAVLHIAAGWVPPEPRRFLDRPDRGDGRC